MKTNKVHFLSDFRNLNKKLKYEPYPMPNINEMLLKLEGIRYSTSLDLNMGYYHIIMTEGASDLCTIVISRIKYHYKCLKTGVINLPDLSNRKLMIYSKDLNLSVHT